MVYNVSFIMRDFNINASDKDIFNPFDFFWRLWTDCHRTNSSWWWIIRSCSVEEKHVYPPQVFLFNKKHLLLRSWDCEFPDWV